MSQFQVSSNETQAIRIVEVNQLGNTLTLNTEILEQILSRQEVRDRSLVVISITGAIRKGKSFMLNFFIRYLKSKYSNGGVSEANWLGNAEQSLTGFSWRGGSERNTIGVLVWPEIFLHDYSNGKKIAIMLIDTQGTFDSKTTFDGNVTIFALSAMISSLQIYNVSNNIQEDQLQYLSLFAEYGKLALQNPLNKPFQKLLFLVRDWFYPYEAEYGYAGGRYILRRALSVQESDDDETKELRENIVACFDEIDCFLMPYPGSQVATNPNFNGKITDIDAEFLNQLQQFVPNLLQPERLITKKVNGIDIRAQDFVYYLRSYMKVLTGNKLPNPKTILSATADAQNLAAISEAREEYGGLMDKLNARNEYLNFGEFTAVHQKNKETAITKFEDIPKLQSSDKTPEQYEHDLEEILKKQFNYYLIRNERNRPDITPKVQELIDAITEEKSISEDLNAKNTKMILDMINTMTKSTDEYRTQVQQLITAFKNSNKKQGYDLMDYINGAIKLIPHVISLIALF